jgi:hypothetical protein
MARVPRDEMDKRTAMEASENAGLSPEGGAGADLHRIDPDRVAQTLGSAKHAGGYARLELMLNSVLPRLVGEPPKRAG